MRACFLICALARVVFAQVDAEVSRPCTHSENLRAENEASKPRGWDVLYRVYRKYGRCDDVDADEGFSESVARIQLTTGNLYLALRSSGPPTRGSGGLFSAMSTRRSTQRTSRKS